MSGAGVVKWYMLYIVYYIYTHTHTHTHMMVERVYAWRRSGKMVYVIYYIYRYIFDVIYYIYRYIFDVGAVV
jgi:hypothetical protein